MSGAVARVVHSMPTHSMSRCRVPATRVMAARKKHRQAQKRRSGWLVKDSLSRGSRRGPGSSSRRKPTAYREARKNRRLDRPKNRRPGASGSRMPFSMGVGGYAMHTPTSARCAAAVAASNTRRKTSAGTTSMISPAASGIHSRTASIISPSARRSVPRLWIQRRR